MSLSTLSSASVVFVSSALFAFIVVGFSVMAITTARITSYIHDNNNANLFQFFLSWALTVLWIEVEILVETCLCILMLDSFAPACVFLNEKRFV